MSSRNRIGFTLAEMMGTLLVLGVLLSLALNFFGRPSPQATLRVAAAQLHRSFDVAHAKAVMSAGDALLVVDGGSYLATRIAPGLDADAAPAGEWTHLPDGITFSLGSTGAGPLGETPTAAVPQDTVRCGVDGLCDLAGQDVVTFYLTHVDLPDAARAVMVTREGTVRVYERTSGGWR